jgi:hypothetical protein
MDERGHGPIIARRKLTLRAAARNCEIARSERCRRFENPLFFCTALPPVIDVVERSPGACLDMQVFACL